MRKGHFFVSPLSHRVPEHLWRHPRMFLEEFIEESRIIEPQAQRNILHRRIFRAQLRLGIHDERFIDNLHRRMPRLFLDKPAEGRRLHIYLPGIIRHLMLPDIVLMYHPDENPVLLEMSATRCLYQPRLFRTKLGHPL